MVWTGDAKIRGRTLLAVVALVAAACGGTEDAGGGAPLVVATTTILGDVVQVVGGDDIEVEVLMPIGADPHAYQASARQAALLRDADLIVANGLGLEEGLEDVIIEAEAEGVPVLWVGEEVDPLPSEGPGGADHDDGDPDDDHDHGAFDPHVWLDPIRMAEAVDVIAARIEPIAGPGTSDRAGAYRAELLALSDEIAQMIETIPVDRRVLVTGHVSFRYFADRYGLTVIGTVIPAATTEAETSAAQFAALVELIEANGVPAIFESATESTDLAEAVAAEAEGEVTVVPLHMASLGGPGTGAESYAAMMRSAAGRIVGALR